MIGLSLNSVVKYFGANLTLKNITFEVQQGERVGLVGRNGCGKSTILKIISGIEKADSGNIAIRRGAVIGYLEQMPKYDEGCTVNEVINLAFSHLENMEQQMLELEKKMEAYEGAELERVLKQYSDIQQKYETAGGYGKQEKFSKVCEGLKFDESFLRKVFSMLSGGEKTTVILGKILLENPDILLLDEPTNHLDMEALEWLEEYLKEYKGTVIIVSHDRYFLDSVVSKIIEVEDLESTTYKGNYSAYVKEKEENMLLQFANYKEQQKKINDMEEAIKSLRDWAIRADNKKFFRRAASMQKRLDKMDKVDRPNLEKQNMRLNFITNGRSGGEVIKVEGASKSFEDKVLFEDGEFLIRYKERSALIGPNGCGKSTLLKLLLKEEAIDKGTVELGANVKAAYLPQNITFEDEDMTVLECFRADIEILEGKAREYLSKFMFFGESVFKKVGNLSGGEKTRLKLSKLLYEDINLLILDEPTNHLDIDSIETLEEALEDFEGTIFFISHDRYFINKISDRIIELENKKFNNYLGNYDYYKIKKKESKQGEKEDKIIKKEKVQRTKNARPLEETKKKEADRIKLEEDIAKLEEEIREIDNKMNALAADYEELNKCYSRKEQLQNELEKVMEEWIKY